MTSNATKFSLILLLLGFNLFFETKANIIWYADPTKALTTVFYRYDQTGFTTGTYCLDSPDNPSVASTQIDPVYGKHWVSYKPANRKRGEFAKTKDIYFSNGGEYYLGWRFYLTAAPEITSELSVFQWKTDASNGAIDTQNYPFNLKYDGTYLTLNCFGPGNPDWTEGPSIDNRKVNIWRKQVPGEGWKSIVLHIKVSSDPTIGYIELWYNDEKQILGNFKFKEYQVVLSNDFTRAYHKTFDGHTVYTKWGAYGGCDNAVTVHLDEMRLATTYDEARPSYYEPNPTGLFNIYGKKELIAVFPNPSINGIFQLKENISWTVYSTVGFKIKSGEGTSVDLSDYPKGIYFFKTDKGIAKLHVN